MLNKNISRQKRKIISIEDLNPSGYLVNFLEKALKLYFIFEEVQDLYYK